jgi:hypothetical protein
MIETFGEWEIGMSNDDVVGPAFLGGTATCGHGNIESGYLAIDSDGTERRCPRCNHRIGTDNKCGQWTRCMNDSLCTRLCQLGTL